MGGRTSFVFRSASDDCGAAGALLALHTVPQRRAILGSVAQQQAREARMRRNGSNRSRVNLRRKNRLRVVCAVLAGPVH